MVASALAAWVCGALGIAHANPQVEVSVVVAAAEGDLPTAIRATLLVTMERALRQDTRLAVVGKDRRLAQRAGLAPEARLSEARGLVKTGEALLGRGRAGLAQDRLRAAVAQLQRSLSLASKTELARAQFLLGAAQAMNGRRNAAVVTFTRLLTWRTDYVADTSIAPRRVLPAWTRAKRRVTRLAGGSIEIRSSPSRSRAYVDGQFVGFTPTTAEGLAVGDHYVTLMKWGHVRKVVRARVSSKVQARVMQKLEALAGATRIAGWAKRVSATWDRSRAPEALSEIGRILGVDHVVVLRVPGPKSAVKRYEVAAYDSRTRRRLAAATLVAAPDQEMEQVFARLSRALYAQISFKPLPKKKPTTTPRKTSRKNSLLSRWWFWAGVTTVVGAAVALPLIIPGGSDDPSCPGGSVCGRVIVSF